MTKLPLEEKIKHINQIVEISSSYAYGDDKEAIFKLYNYVLEVFKKEYGENAVDEKLSKYWTVI